MDGAPPKNFSSAGLPAMTSCHGAYLFVPLFNPIGVPRRHAARVGDEGDRRGEDRARPLGVAGTHGGGRRARWPLPRMWGYFSIPEFEALNHAKGFSVIERDEHFEPAPVREVRR